MVIKPFISYAHGDDAYLNDIIENLTIIKSWGYFNDLEFPDDGFYWTDRNILSGEWYKEIIKAIDEADFFILMISRKFLVSEFIKRQEWLDIKEAHAKGIPVSIISVGEVEIPKDERNPFSAFQALNFDSPLNAVKSDDGAYDKVLNMIQRKIVDIIKTKIIGLSSDDIADTQKETQLVRHNLLEKIETILKRDNKNKLVTIYGASASGKSNLAESMLLYMKPYFDFQKQVKLRDISEEEIFLNKLSDELFDIPNNQQDIKNYVQEGFYMFDDVDEQKVLIVLDNCEQLIPILREYIPKWFDVKLKNLSIIATSTDRIGISGEIPFPMEALSFEDEENYRNESVDRFLQLIYKDGRIDTTFDVKDVYEICRNLQGQIYAINLAGNFARIKGFNYLKEKVLENLSSFNSKVQGEEAVILFEIIYQSLNLEQQVIIRILSLFNAAFNEDLAWKILKINGISSKAFHATLKLIVDLDLYKCEEVIHTSSKQTRRFIYCHQGIVQKSLFKRIVHFNDEPNKWLHSFAEIYSDYIEENLINFDSNKFEEAQSNLEIEQSNIETVYSLCIRFKQYKSAFLLFKSYLPYLSYNGPHNNLLSIIEKLESTKVLEHVSLEENLEYKIKKAVTYGTLGNYPSATEISNEAISISQENNYKQYEYIAWLRFERYRRNKGVDVNVKTEDIINMLEDGIVYYKQRDAKLSNYIKASLGYTYKMIGNYNLAIAYLTESREYFVANKNYMSLCETENWLGLTYWHIGEMRKAVRYYNSSADILERYKSKIPLSGRLTNIGLAYTDLNEHNEAIKNYQDAEEIHRKGNRSWQANNWSGWGYSLCLLGIKQKDETIIVKGKNLIDSAISRSLERESDTKSDVIMHKSFLADVLYEELKFSDTIIMTERLLYTMSANGEGSTSRYLRNLINLISAKKMLNDRSFISHLDEASNLRKHLFPDIDRIDKGSILMKKIETLDKILKDESY